MSLIKKFILKTWALVPFKKIVFKCIRSIWVPPKSINQYLYFNDRFKVNIDTNNHFRLQNYGRGFTNEASLFWFGFGGGWEKTSRSLWLELCKCSEVIIDIGANTGVYSVIAKTVNNKAKVYAYEPVKRVYDKLLYNMEINGYDVVCMNTALSNKDGYATLYDFDQPHQYSASLNKEFFADIATSLEIKDIKMETKIETRKLSSEIERLDLKKIDLMKIDVEKHELEVLAGMEDFLQKFKPSILIEILDDDTGDRIQRIFQDMDYMFYNIDENNGYRRVKKIVKSDDYNYLLCTNKVRNRLGLQ